jgi:hypothetical protein
MSACRVAVFAAFDEFLESIGSCRLEQPIAYFDTDICRDQGFVDQVSDAVDDA